MVELTPTNASPEPDDAAGNPSSAQTGWFVALAGSQNDLNRLMQLELKSFDVVEHETWTCLKSPLFDTLSDHNDVLNLAEQTAIPRLRGLATLLDTGRPFGSVTAEGNVFRYDEQGLRDGRCFISSDPVRITIGATLRVDAIGGSPTPRDPFLDQAEAAASLPDVDKVLALFGAIDQANWTYYTHHVWELIRFDVGRKLAPQGTKRFVKHGGKQVETLGWLTGDEIDSLRSVHDPNIVGPSARHSVQELAPPKHPIRSSSQALTILRKLIRHWIQHNSNQLPPVSTQPSSPITQGTAQSQSPAP